MIRDLIEKLPNIIHDSIYRRTRKALQHRTVYYDMPETETKTYQVKEEKRIKRIGSKK